MVVVLLGREFAKSLGVLASPCRLQIYDAETKTCLKRADSNRARPLSGRNARVGSHLCVIASAAKQSKPDRRDASRLAMTTNG
jgi:hypothetical protein